MKTLLLIIALALFMPFGLSKVHAEPDETSMKNDMLNEILIAENEEDDEDLFMDDDEDDGEDEEVAEEEVEEEEEAEEAEEEEVAEEEPAPAPAPKKPVAKKAVPNKRAPANFKGGFKVLSMNCQLHSDASDSSDVILTTPSGKKLWLDGHSEGWYKGYHKKGHGYFPAGCFE